MWIRDRSVDLSVVLRPVSHDLTGSNKSCELIFALGVVIDPPVVDVFDLPLTSFPFASVPRHRIVIGLLGRSPVSGRVFAHNPATIWPTDVMEFSA